MELKQGLFRIDPKEYHAMPGLSYTGIKDFQRSPAHFLEGISGERQETPAMIFGSAYHAYLLENEVFKAQYNVKPSDLEKIHAMARVLWDHPWWKRFSPGSEREIAMIWYDTKWEIWCRTRIDLLQPNMGMPVDLKTCVDARPHPFLQAAFRFGYHIQAAWTLRGLKTITEKDHDAFAFIGQEKGAPYAVNVYEATDKFIEQGNKEIDQVLPVYADCLKTGKWPGYDPSVKPLILPPWVANITDIQEEV